MSRLMLSYIIFTIVLAICLAVGVFSTLLRSSARPAVPENEASCRVLLQEQGEALREVFRVCTNRGLSRDEHSSTICQQPLQLWQEDLRQGAITCGGFAWFAEGQAKLEATRSKSEALVGTLTQDLQSHE